MRRRRRRRGHKVHHRSGVSHCHLPWGVGARLRRRMNGRNDMLGVMRGRPRVASRGKGHGHSGRDGRRARAGWNGRPAKICWRERIVQEGVRIRGRWVSLSYLYPWAEWRAHVSLHHDVGRPLWTWRTRPGWCPVGLIFPAEEVVLGHGSALLLRPWPVMYERMRAWMRSVRWFPSVVGGLFKEESDAARRLGSRATSCLDAFRTTNASGQAAKGHEKGPFWAS